MPTPKPIGLTQDQGWQIGVRRTLPIHAHHAWQFLMTPPGLTLWLGEGIPLPLQKGAVFTTTAGTHCDIRSYTEGSLIRLRWHPIDLPQATTLQVRLLPAKTGTTLSFHHERLTDAAHRDSMRHHWTTVLDQLTPMIQP
jgi:uncharacterized protein YndB with AHSA1/START domain